MLLHPLPVVHADRRRTALSNTMQLPDITREPGVHAILRAALREDIGRGDVTTRALIPARAVARADLVSRQECTVAGAAVTAALFQMMDARLKVRIAIRDGQRAGAGQRVMRITGPAKSILTAERVALNFIQRLSGIATLTAAFVRGAGPRNVAVMDTRKTTPGLRRLEKYAVRCGGGRNHRMGLDDMILIKDNHRMFWAGEGGLGEAVRTARRAYPHLPIEIEVESEAELRDALAGRPDWILLDNMPTGLMARCVKIARGRCKLEASGGIGLGNIRRIARTGVDAISIGRLTHSAPAIDMSLELEVPQRARNYSKHVVRGNNHE